MTSMQSLDLGSNPSNGNNNDLTGAFRFFDVFHCIPCYDLSIGMSSCVPAWRLMWQYGLLFVMRDAQVT
jgi:hypothetical protein